MQTTSRPRENNATAETALCAQTRAPARASLRRASSQTCSPPRRPEKSRACTPPSAHSKSRIASAVLSTPDAGALCARFSHWASRAWTSALIFDSCHGHYRNLREWLAESTGQIRALDPESHYDGYHWRPAQARAAEFISSRLNAVANLRKALAKILKLSRTQAVTIDSGGNCNAQIAVAHDRSPTHAHRSSPLCRGRFCC